MKEELARRIKSWLRTWMALSVNAKGTESFEMFMAGRIEKALQAALDAALSVAPEEGRQAGRVRFFETFREG